MGDKENQKHGNHSTNIKANGDVIDYQKQIEEHAVEYLSTLAVGMPPFLMGRTISFFEFSLSKKGLLDDDFEITHSKKLTVPTNWITHMETLAVRIAHIYGTKHIELINHGEKCQYSFAFVGYKGDVHACYVSLKKLLKLAEEVRQTFIKSKSKRMKPENKEKHADDFIYDWVEEMAFNLNPTALTRDTFDDLNEYIAENFHAEKEYNECALAFLNFIKLGKESDEKITIGDLKNLYMERFGHDLAEKVRCFQDIEKEDLLVEWSWSCLDKYSPYGDKNPDYDEGDD